jgi:ABC-type sulfate/molybdate transport systems ATPase subunit
VLLAGASGSGKSTLLRAVAGVVPHAIAADMTGRVIVVGRDTTSVSIADLAQTVGLLFQNPGVQLFKLTVGEEVAFGARSTFAACSSTGSASRLNRWPRACPRATCRRCSNRHDLVLRGNIRPASDRIAASLVANGQAANGGR